MGRLSKKQKMLLRVCYQVHTELLELTVKEIAEITGFSRENVSIVFENLQNNELADISVKYLKTEFPDYDEELEVINKPILKEEELKKNRSEHETEDLNLNDKCKIEDQTVKDLELANNRKRKEQKAQALNLATELQDALIKLDKWDETTCDLIDRIHEQMLKREQIALEAALTGNANSVYSRKCVEQFEFKTDIYNMALNILNQKIVIREEIKYGEFIELPEFIFCATYVSLAGECDEFRTLSNDEQTDVTQSTPEPKGLQKTYTLAQEGI